jgi:ribosome-binding factor A
MWSRRMERINELLLREISSFVTGRHDPQIGFITFTGVEVTEDLMDAKVFYSVLGNEEERERAAQRLEQISPEIWRSLRHLESLRRIPKLQYIYDETPSRAARVFEIIETLHHQEGAPADRPAPAPPPEPRAPAERKPKGSNTRAERSHGRKPPSKKTR